MYADEQSLEMVKAYSMFEKGILPNAGGWLDQPVKFLQAMTVIRNQIERMQDEKKGGE